MSQPKSLAFDLLDLPVLPALLIAVLCLGAAVHQHPAILRPLLALAAALSPIR